MLTRKMIFIAVPVVVGAAVVGSMFVARRLDEERARRIPIEPGIRRDAPTYQLPTIVAHFDHGGVAVTLGNDASDRLVVIDAERDKLVVTVRSPLARSL